MISSWTVTKKYAKYFPRCSFIFLKHLPDILLTYHKCRWITPHINNFLEAIRGQILWFRTYGIKIYTVEWHDYWRMNLKGRGMKRRGLMWYTLPRITSVRTAGLQTYIWTTDPQKTKQEWHPLQCDVRLWSRDSEQYDHMSSIFWNVTSTSMTEVLPTFWRNVLPPMPGSKIGPNTQPHRSKKIWR
jgi:hypothetical protein